MFEKSKAQQIDIEDEEEEVYIGRQEEEFVELQWEEEEEITWEPHKFVWYIREKVGEGSSGKSRTEDQYNR